MPPLASAAAWSAARSARRRSTLATNWTGSWPAAGDRPAASGGSGVRARGDQGDQDTGSHETAEIHRQAYDRELTEVQWRFDS